MQQHIIKEVFDPAKLPINNYSIENESQKYKACQFELGNVKIISRNAKITPKKVGQFVTFWKRSTTGLTEPFSESDRFDAYIVNVETKNAMGQFVFPKAVLIEKGIVASSSKEGKRGFRVYPSWDTPTSKQAIGTQQWQLNYFFKLYEENWKRRVKALYHL
ncbi:MepB family protein [Aquimarina sp. W85]|uniref:MepB family protein n=1 Tax=Aquimarina rhodophyticola TaxID=3342246 RepID=UPI0036726883